MLSSKSKRGGKKRRGRGVYISVSFPTPLLLEVDKVVAELGYWPAKTHFMHEAVMEKLEWAKREIEARRHAEKQEKAGIK